MHYKYHGRLKSPASRIEGDSGTVLTEAFPHYSEILLTEPIECAI